MGLVFASSPILVVTFGALLLMLAEAFSKKTLQGEYITQELLNLGKLGVAWLWQSVLIVFILLFLLLEGDMLANEKRNLYLQVIPATLIPLKDKSFKLEAAKEEKVGDKPAVGVKVTAPDGKDFTIYFDKESGLPVKVVAKVLGFMGDEFTQESLLGSYKEFDSIKIATKSEVKRNGEKFLDGEVTEFKVLDNVDPKTFAKPE